MKEGRKQHEWMNEFGGWGGKQAKFTTERGQRKEEGWTENWKDGWKWKLAAHRRHRGEVISKRRMREYKTEKTTIILCSLFFCEALTDPGAWPACGKLPPAIMRTPAHVGEGSQLLFGLLFAKNKFGQEKMLN